MSDQTQASDPQVSIPIDLDNPQDDPSGGFGKVKSVSMSHRVKSIHPDTKIIFTFKEDDGSTFTAFRYYNTTLRKEGWYRPQGVKKGPGKEGWEFHEEQIAPGGKSISVKDKTSAAAIYLYIVEWTDANGNIWVCDPKIKNQP